MKHYAKLKNGYEYDLLHPSARRYVCHKAKTLAYTKHAYRKRERSMLKRETMRAYEAHVDEVHAVADEVELAMAEIIEAEAVGDAMRYTDAFARLHEAESNLTELAR